jgi:hypothetical protein
VSCPACCTEPQVSTTCAPADEVAWLSMVGNGRGRRLDSTAAAELLGVTRRTVVSYVWRGTLPPPDGKDGRHLWWYEQTLLNWQAGAAGRKRRRPNAGR